MFTIPNHDTATYANPQSIWMDADTDALQRGLAGSNVISGAGVTQQGAPDMTVAVAAGSVNVNGTVTAVAGGNGTIGAAHATETRIDVISVNSSGTIVVTAGTGVVTSGSGGPVAPQIPANSVILAMVTVPPTVTAIVTAMIIDKRVPVAVAKLHAASHASGAADAIKLDDLAAPDDNTDLNATTSAHGLLVKATAPASGLLSAVGIGNGETAYTNKPLFDTTNPAALGTAGPGTQLVAARRDHIHALPAIDATAAATDITDRNASTSAHGLLKKLSNVATEFMNGVGNWAVPSGGKILQTIYGSTSTGGSNATATLADTGLTVTITPASTSNKVRIRFNLALNKVTNADVYATIAIDRGGSTILTVASTALYTGSTVLSERGMTFSFEYEDAPASVSALTYKIRYSSSTGADGIGVQQGSTYSSIVAEEIAG